MLVELNSKSDKNSILEVPFHIRYSNLKYSDTYKWNKSKQIYYIICPSAIWEIFSNDDDV